MTSYAVPEEPDEAPELLQTFPDACGPSAPISKPGDCSQAEILHICASPLTLAAAQNDTERVSLLLAQGADVNETLSAAPLRMIRTGDADWQVLTGTFGDGVSNIFAAFSKSRRKLSWYLWNLTPLAAAIVCGSVETAELLLARPDTRVIESCAVCRAAVYALLGTPRQRQCARLAFRLTGSEEEMEEELLRQRAIHLDFIADLCSPRQLAMRLRGGPCTAEELARAANIVSAHADQMAADELRELFAAWPKQDRTGLAQLAQPSPHRTDQENAAILESWHSASGGEISGLPQWTFRNTLGDDGAERVRETLRPLASGGPVRAAAESPWIPPLAEQGGEALALLLKTVRFYRAHPRGISALAAAILRQNDLELLRLAAQVGALEQEPRSELLAFLAEHKLGMASRAFVLTRPVREERREDYRQGLRGCCWTSRWRGVSDWDRFAWLAFAWEYPLPYDQCVDRVETVAWDEGFTLKKGRERFPFLRRPSRRDLSFWAAHPNYFPWATETDMGNLYVAGACGDNPELLRAALDYRVPLGERFSYRLDQEGEELRGSLLCLAAAAGRTEQVKLLLDRGADPNEDELFLRSCLYGPNFPKGIVTPLAMAERMGHEDTAAVLRSRGARPMPEPTQPPRRA